MNRFMILVSICLLVSCTSMFDGTLHNAPLQESAGAQALKLREVDLDNVILVFNDEEGLETYALIHEDDLPSQTSSILIRGKWNKSRDKLQVLETSKPLTDVTTFAPLPSRKDEYHAAVLTTSALYFVCLEEDFIEPIADIFKYPGLTSANYVLVRGWRQLHGDRVTDASYAVVLSDVSPRELYSSPREASILAFVDYDGGGGFELLTQPEGD